MNRDPRLLAGAIVSGLVLWMLIACGPRRASPESRAQLNCEYSARYDGRLTDAERVRAIEACGK